MCVYTFDVYSLYIGTKLRGEISCIFCNTLARFTIHTLTVTYIFFIFFLTLSYINKQTVLAIAVQYYRIRPA